MFVSSLSRTPLGFRFSDLLHIRASASSRSMRTRNADTPKSGGTKRTPPQKAAAADKTPETTPKSTPKETRAAKAKQSAAKAAAVSTPVASDPKPETKVEEVETPVVMPAVAVEEKKSTSAAKSPEKKASARKSPLAAKIAAAAKGNSPPKVEDVHQEPVIVENPEVKPEEKPEEKEEVVKMEEDKKEEAVEVKAEMKAEAACDVKEEGTEAKDAKKEKDVAQEEEAMEEDSAPPPAEERFLEPEAEELAVADNVGVGEEAAEGEEAGPEHQDDVQDQEDVGVEVDEQMEISDMAKARKIKKEREIFVGGLDRDATEEDVKKEFEKAGEVIEVRILKDFVTNKNKGFAFVKYATKEQASKALSELKNPTIRGKRCGIAPSEDNDTLFLGNICNTWTKEAIRRKLKDYGIDTVVSITLVPDTQNEGLSRGFAFLEFPCHADAMVAYKRLQKPDVIFGHPDRTAKVAFAEPLREPDPEVMAQVKSVFVDGLPPYWDEDRVKEQFKGYGEIERVVLARNMSTAKRNDFGFVNFTTHEAAVTCIEAVNNMELGDGKSKTKARARLANPLPKTQAVKGGMSGGFRIGHSGMGGYPRFGRGFGRGRFPSHRAGFQGGRGFVPRGRGRGRFPFAADNEFETSYSEFRGGWRPFGPRGGRRISTSARRGGFDRGRGKVFPSRRPPFPPEEDFSGPFGPRHFGEDPYFYGDVGQGMKRPFSMMEHDPGYLDPVSRTRPRYDHTDPMTGGTRYRDSLGMGGLYSRDYYGSDYGGSTYSSLYGGEPSGSGYYY